jgi:hypothetical protein
MANFTGIPEPFATKSLSNWIGISTRIDWDYSEAEPQRITMKNIHFSLDMFRRERIAGPALLALISQDPSAFQFPPVEWINRGTIVSIHSVSQ